MVLKAHPGYLGIARINDQEFRCSSFDINPQQTPLFYDHTIGLNDTIPLDSSTKGEILGTRNTQKRIWRPSPINITGGMSFPCSYEDNSNPKWQYVFDRAIDANYFDVYFNPYCEKSRRFLDCRINTFNFSCQAGDIANISLDVAAMSMELSEAYRGYDTAEKLLTWDVVKVQVSQYEPVANLKISGFNFTVNNNIETIFTCRGNNQQSMFPYDLRAGMQEVTGSVVMYLEQGQEFIPLTLEDYAIIELECPGFSTLMHVVFSSNKLDGVIGPVVTELPFTGVDKVFY